MKKNRKTIGLALGAGAARGTAHLGVLRAIRELEIPIDVIAGTSIGSLVGGVFASGRVDRLEEALLKMDWKEIIYHFFEVSFPRNGLVDGKRIVEFISDFVHPTDIRDLPIPFRAVATDVTNGEEIVLSEGPLIECIRASIAMPGIFTPVLRGEEVLVDGGLVNPVPVSVVREMGADFVIAVDINSGRVGAKKHQEDPPAPQLPEPESDEDAAWRDRVSAAMNSQLERIDRSIKERMSRLRKPDGGPNIVDILGNTIRIMEAQIGDTQLKISKPDVLIRPDVGSISFMEFNRTREGIDAGYAAAYSLLEAAKKKL